MSPAIAKPQVFIARPDGGQSFSDEWVDKDKIINIDYSSMMGYIVTCEGVTNMSYMFSRVELYGLDLSNFDTSNVTQYEEYV